MQKWEYRIVSLYREAKDSVAGTVDLALLKGEKDYFRAYGRYLDQLGQEGWEIVAGGFQGGSYFYTLKRPTP